MKMSNIKNNLLIILVLLCINLNLQAEMTAKDKVFFKKFTQKKRNINSIKLKYLKRFFRVIDIHEKKAVDVYDQKKKGDITNDADLKKAGLNKKEIKKLKKYFVLKKRKPKKKKVKKEEETEVSVSDIAEEQEIEEDEAIEALQKYLENPMNINKASRAELLELPELSSVIVTKIISYRQKQGGFKTLSELRNIKEIDDEVYRKIKPFITTGIEVKEIESADGKGVTTLKKSKTRNFKGSFIIRVDNETAVDDRYQSRNTNYFFKEDSGYKFLYNRLYLEFFNHLNVELVGERDFGEAGVEPGKSLGVDKLEIYDMTTWNVYLDNVGPIKRLLIGDYRMEIAQGLLFEQSVKLVILKAGIYKAPVKKKDRGIKPHHSPNQSRTLYGVAGQIELGPVMILPFYSQKRFNSQMKNRDSDDNDNDGIDNDADLDKDGDGIIDTVDDNVEYSVATSIDDIVQYTDGDYHRTGQQIRNKENFTEDLIGSRIKLKLFNERVNIGGTYYQAEYSHLVDPDFSGRDKYHEFRGRGINVGSLDYDLYYKNFNFYGELARSCYTVETWQTNRSDPDFAEKAILTNRNGKEETGYGKVIGLISDFKIFKLSTLYFDLDPDYYSPHANVFNENDRNIQGFFQGFYGKCSRDLKIWGYGQVHRKKWRSYDMGTLTYKQEYKGGFINRVTRFITFEWQGTYQYGTDQYDPDERTRLVLRYQLEWKPVKVIQVRFRYENTKVRFPMRNEEADADSGNKEYEYGDVGYAQIKTKLTKRLTVYNRLMYFQTTGSEAKVYVYENELLYWTRPVRSFSGQGYRYFIFISNKLTDDFTFQTKYSVTHEYYNQNSYSWPKHKFQVQCIYKW